MKKVLIILAILLSLSLVACSNNDTSIKAVEDDKINLVSKEEENIDNNFHENVNKYEFESTTIIDIITQNRDFLDKRVSVQGKVYTYVIDSYGNFDFKIFDGTGDVECYWYSKDKQQSKNMFKKLEDAQYKSQIADNYYNVIVYGVYKENPKKVGEYNIFVYDIEFPDVELSEDATLGGIPIWGDHPDIKIEDN